MTLPREMPPGPGERTKRVLQRSGQGLSSGFLGASQPVQPRVPSVTVTGTAAKVAHYDDPDFPRPVAEFVYWKGAATPNNADPDDFWYPSNDF